MEFETVLEEVNDIYKKLDLNYGKVKDLLQDFEDNVMSLYFKFRKLSSAMESSKLGKDKETDPDCYDDIVHKVALILEGYLCILEGYITNGPDLRTSVYPQIDRRLGHVYGLSPLENKQFFQDLCRLELSNLNRIVEQSEMSMTPFLTFLVEFIRDYAQSVEQSFSSLNDTYTSLTDFQDHMTTQREEMRRRCEAIIARENEVARKKKDAEAVVRYVVYDSDDYDDYDCPPPSPHYYSDYEEYDMEVEEDIEKRSNEIDLTNNESQTNLKKS